MRTKTTIITAAAILLAALAMSAARLDKGMLDPDWFGEGVQFRTTKDIDYLWVKPGFSLQGRTLHIRPWSDPVFLAEDKKRDAKDAAKAMELTEVMPGRLRGALMLLLGGIAQVSRDEGDVAVTGRFVDCNAGSKAAKWIVGMGAGSATATWDLRFTDVSSGEVLVAVHHRAVSGTTMSEIDDKIIKWLEKFGESAKTGFADFYQGKPATR
jgi:hypothetical protein